MRLLTIKNFIRHTSGAMLLGLVLLAGTASAASINPNIKLDGIPPIGNPSFMFDTAGGDYSKTINNWFSNLVYLSRTPSKKRYKLHAFNQGDFTFAASENKSYEGTDGQFQLIARFNKKGKLIGGRVVMTGIIEELGITKKKVLYRGSLERYTTRNRMLAFAMNNIRCAAEIENCQDDKSVSEGIYLKLQKKLPTIKGLGKQKFSTTVIANTTTVPLPAGVWLMLSALGALVVRARLKRTA